MDENEGGVINDKVDAFVESEVEKERNGLDGQATKTFKSFNSHLDGTIWAGVCLSEPWIWI